MFRLGPAGAVFYAPATFNDDAGADVDKRVPFLEAASSAVVIKSEGTVISSLGSAKNNYDARAPSGAVSGTASTINLIPQTLAL